MELVSAEYARLRLITLSQQRLQLAQVGNWQGLKALDVVWNDSLTLAIDEFGDKLEPAVNQLIKDNDELTEIVKKKQNDISFEFYTVVKKMLKAQEYLK